MLEGPLGRRCWYSRSSKFLRNGASSGPIEVDICGSSVETQRESEHEVVTDIVCIQNDAEYFAGGFSGSRDHEINNLRIHVTDLEAKVSSYRI